MPYVDRLLIIKDEKHLSNATIAKVGDVPLATVTRVFNKTTMNPTFETIARIAIGMGVSLDELVGMKQPDSPPITSPIENALSTSVELLGEKNSQIQALKDEVERQRKEKRTIVGILSFVITSLLVILTISIILK